MSVWKTSLIHQKSPGSEGSSEHEKPPGQELKPALAPPSPDPSCSVCGSGSATGVSCVPSLSILIEAPNLSSAKLREPPRLLSHLYPPSLLHSSGTCSEAQLRLLPHYPTAGYVILRAQHRMKTQGPLFKRY